MVTFIKYFDTWKLICFGAICGTYYLNFELLLILRLQISQPFQKSYVVQVL